VTGLSADILPRSYLGGMRWGHNLNATFPSARLALTAGGVTGGPSAKFLGPLVPTHAYRWEDLARIERVRWPFVPFIADGVRFMAPDVVSSRSGFIFWSGSSWRSKRILDFCDSVSPGLVSRERQLAPLFGL